MIIEKIKVSNFKRVEVAELKIENITYIIGGNNSGKSSILQAIHMAAGCAQLASELQQQVIAESILRYCPTGDFQTLGCTGPYENRADGSRGIVEFFGKTSDAADASYKIEIYKARNYNNIGVNRTGVYPGFGQTICDSSNLFSVYVPGLAGIPHYEEMQSFASVFRKAAGGEANLVFRNIIRILNDRDLLQELESVLFNIVGYVKFKITFDQNKDLYVDVRVSLDSESGNFVPIDLSGTGFIQITQIVSYAILFKPKLLLIDEPDSHLHPSRQMLLSKLFEEIAIRYDCKIIVSTHSRHLVSAAPDDAALIWMKNGEIEPLAQRDLAKILLDLGALDQIDITGADIIICTEDRGSKPLERAVASLSSNKRIKVISYNGVTNAASAVVIQQMSNLFPSQPKIIIHRDRDFLNNDEIEHWGAEFKNRGMLVFCPSLSDIEAFHCSAEHLVAIYGLEIEKVEEELKIIIEANKARFYSEFSKKRRDAIARYWKDGGGPKTSDIWPEEEYPKPENIMGKYLLGLINDKFGEKFNGRKNVYGDENKGLAKELREFLGANGL